MKQEILTGELKEAPLLKLAQQMAGATHWGDDTFWVPFRILLDCFENQARLNPMGRQVVQDELLSHLTNRLTNQATISRTPEITQQPVERPLFVIGFPRTGTTLLHNLLALDTDNGRAPRLWELLHPSPLPGHRSHEQDPRVGRAQDLIHFYHGIPGMRAIHDMTVNGTEECRYLLKNSFTYAGFGLRDHIPAYMDWFYHNAADAAYADHKQQLQIMQWGKPAKRWILKDPTHLATMDALLKVYPDACIVQTHRSPEAFVASMCSLLYVSRQPLSDAADPLQVRDTTMQFLEKAMIKNLKVRDTVSASHFYDVDYSQLVADPISVVKNIYRHFQLPYPEAMNARIPSYLAENRRNKHGKHSYTLEEYGLTQDQVQQRFKPYIQRFGL